MEIASIPIQLIMLFTMYLSIKGSRYFVDGYFHLGAVMFTVANFANIIAGLHFNLFFTLAQTGLMYFTVRLFDFKTEADKIFFKYMFLFSIVLAFMLGNINIENISFQAYGIIDISATLTAWYGSYMMSKNRFLEMSLAWIIADIGFLWIAYEHSLIGLAVTSIFFIYHGFLRLQKEERVKAIFNR